MKGGYSMAKGAYVEASLLESKAYLSLNGLAPQVLMLFMLKRQFKRVSADKRGKSGKKICVNLDCLSLTYIEAEKKHGITQPRFTRAIDELLEKGFLTKTHPGGGYQKDKARYGLSDKYRMWQPGSVIENRKKDLLQRGFRKPKRQSTGQCIATRAQQEQPCAPKTSEKLPGPIFKMLTERKSASMNNHQELVKAGGNSTPPVMLKMLIKRQPLEANRKWPYDSSSTNEGGLNKNDYKKKI
jgi:hypothetical protein